MSKGSKIVPVRIPEDLLKQMDLTISRRNFWSKEEAWTTSRFIQIAIREKLHKMERGRSGRYKSSKKADKTRNEVSNGDVRSADSSDVSAVLSDTQTA